SLSFHFKISCPYTVKRIVLKIYKYPMITPLSELSQRVYDTRLMQSLIENQVRKINLKMLHYWRKWRSRAHYIPYQIVFGNHSWQKIYLVCFVEILFLSSAITIYSPHIHNNLLNLPYKVMRKLDFSPLNPLPNCGSGD